MTRLPKAFLVVSAFLALTLSLSACDGTGPEPPEPPTEVDSDGDGINDNVDNCDNEPEDNDGFEDGDGCPEDNPPAEITIPVDVTPDDVAVTAVASGDTLWVGDKDVTRSKGTTLEVRAVRDGYRPTERALTFDEPHSVSITLEKRPPETVTITVGATLDTDVIVGPDVYEVEITSANGSIERSTPLREFLDTPLELELTQADEPVTLTARVKYGTYKLDYAVWRLAVDSLTFTPDHNRSVTLALESLIACSDGIDNDHDADDGGGADAADDGCVGDDGSYDPEDDVERLDGWTHTFHGWKADQSISNNPDHWQDKLGVTDLNYRIQYAVGPVKVNIEVQIESGKTDGPWALKGKCGPDPDSRDNINVSELVPDDPDVDGWSFPAVYGVTRDWFATGSNCMMYAVHEAKLEDEPGEGNNDVVYLLEHGDETRARRYSWRTEPEETPDKDPNGSALMAAPTGELRHAENVTRAWLDQERQ